MGRPRSENKLVAVTFRLPQNVIDKIQRLADTREISFQEMARRLLVRSVEKEWTKMKMGEHHGNGTESSDGTQ